MPSARNRVVFTVVPAIVFFGAFEFFLRTIHYEGTTIADLEAAEGIPDNMYLHRRDRILGSWFVDDPEYPNLKRSNPWRVGRGFHNQKISMDSGSRTRLFALGGSTTYGTPYEHEKLGFPEATQRALNSRENDQWEVINMGVAGMDASGFPHLINEIKELDADGLIIYTGNNEIRGALLEACTNPYREGIQRTLNEIRIIQLLQDQYRRFRKVSVQPSEINRQQSDCMQEALSASFQESPTATQFPLRDDPLYWRAVERFKDGLTRSLELAEEHGLPVFLVVPAINLLASPEHAAPNTRLDTQTRDRFETALQKAQISDALEDWQNAYALDPTHALVNYQIGHHLINKSEIIAARTHLETAAERDYLSKRPTPHLQKEMLTFCNHGSNVHCVDVSTVFEEKSPNGIAGSELFVDFCHPNQSQGIPLISATLSEAIMNSELGDKR